jgi:uncharacterized membrane protein YiaA
MLLNHFADPFQNGHATVDQFFGESNNLTEQYNPGYDHGVGFGYTQNTSGYEWGNDRKEHYANEHGLADNGNGGLPVAASGCSSGGCGNDPAALARANLEWEQREAAHGANVHGTHERGNNQTREELEEATSGLAITDYLYHIGPDALDFDPEIEVAPSGMEYWKKRVPSVLINLITVFAWMWIWTHFGLSAQLPGTVATVVYWGFIAVMVIGAFQSDHRAARYEEEREQLVSVESNLQLIIKVIAGAVALLLGFKLLDGKTAAVKQNVYIALAIAFFGSLFGVMSFNAKKRGESVRRYRKIKSAVLNLSVALIAVAAMLTFNVGTSLAGAPDKPEAQRVVQVVRKSPGRGGKAQKGGRRVPSASSASSADIIEEIEFVKEPTRVIKQVLIPGEVKYESVRPSPAESYSAPPPMAVAPTILQPSAQQSQGTLHPVQQPPNNPY